MDSKKTFNLRPFFSPVQPTVKRTAEFVTYTEYQPHQTLQNLIFCYWQLSTTRTLDARFNYQIVADGCIDIFVDLNNPDESFVMGFCKTHKEFALEKTFNYFGIRFFPAAFPQLFNINAKELTNQSEHLGHVLPVIAAFIRNSVRTNSPTRDIISEFNRLFSGLVSRSDVTIDPRLSEAILIILRRSGALNIEKDLDTGLSPRQLRRLFEFYIGDTAKTFSQVVRFQKILKSDPTTHSLRQNKSFFDFGYYDQAHFIKEFKTFYGVTPTTAFGR